jgi:seryl-tRNA synthetase
MNQHFYSTTACSMINYWPPEVAEFIYEFALKTPAAAKKAEMLPTTVSSEQINEAREDSYDLVKEYLTANARWQKVLNDIDDNREKIKADLELVAKTIKKLVDEPDIETDVTLAELEKQNKKLKAQEPVLDDLEKELAVWRTEELEVLKEKWEKHWQEHKKTYVNELITKLESECNMSLSEIEKAELNMPTKNLEELLIDLRNFYPDGLPKGWDESSDLFKLRALWVIGAYRSRTLTTTES